MSRRVPPWLDVALGEIGTSEDMTSRSNPRIIEYHKATTLKATDDRVAWCSSYCNWCFLQVGIVGTDSARARSWLGWGEDVPLDKWKLGAVAVFTRDNNPAFGHVGFVIDYYGGMLDILSGNHHNRVRLAKFDTQGLLGLRWPKIDTAQLPS